MLSYILSNSVPGHISEFDSDQEWYVYTINLAEKEILQIEAKVISHTGDEPRYKIRKMTHLAIVGIGKLEPKV